MFCVTLTALGNLIYKNLVAKNIPLLLITVLLFVVAVVLVVQAGRSLKRIRAAAPETAPE